MAWGDKTLLDPGHRLQARRIMQVIVDHEHGAKVHEEWLNRWWRRLGRRLKGRSARLPRIQPDYSWLFDALPPDEHELVREMIAYVRSTL